VSDHTLYDTMARTDGSLALAHQKGIRYKLNGVFVNITGDINNLNPNETQVTVPVEVYGNKAASGVEIIGHTFAPTFTVEAIRNPVTKHIAQPWLVDLLDKAAKKGADNKGEFQLFDLLDENLPAHEGTFSIMVAPATTGYQDKGGYAFTLQSDGVVDVIPSPIAGDGSPIIETASPAGQAVGEQIVVRGYNFTGTTGITVDSETVDEFTVVDANTIVLVIPAAVSGSAPIVVTNASGASDSFAYTAAS